MAVATNSAGDFEVVDADGAVQGTGHVDADQFVIFHYGDGDGDVPDTTLTEAEFETAVAQLPQFKTLTIRPAPEA